MRVPEDRVSAIAGIRTGQSSTEPMILVMTGGGGDGHDLLRAYAAFLEWLPHPASFRSVVVTGPLMSRTRRQEMTSRFRDVPHQVEVLTFTDRLEELIADASEVVSMAGYNSVVEVLSAGKPSLLIPRERPRLEQRIRAERLAERVPAVEWSPASQSPTAGRMEAQEAQAKKVGMSRMRKATSET